MPGVFAVGDNRAGQVRRIMIALGSGAMGATMVHRYIQTGNHPSSI